MAAYQKFNVFTQDLTAAKHDFSSHTYKVMLTNTLPVATNAVKADITEIAGGGSTGYTAGGTATTVTRNNTSGTETIFASDVVFTAGSAGMGPFQYAVLYNDTQTTPAKPLVAFFAYTSSISLAAGETFTVDFDGTNGLFTLG